MVLPRVEKITAKTIVEVDAASEGGFIGSGAGLILGAVEGTSIDGASVGPFVGRNVVKTDGKVDGLTLGADDGAGVCNTS